MPITRLQRCGEDNEQNQQPRFWGRLDRLLYFMRFERHFRPFVREITKRRIGCAKRAVQKQRDKIPLFSDQIIWPDPVERIQKFDKENFDSIVLMRKRAAAKWVAGRLLLRSMPQKEQIEFLIIWNKSSVRGSSEYFMDAVRRFNSGM